jgi:hypothetical protein
MKLLSGVDTPFAKLRLEAVGCVGPQFTYATREMATKPASTARTLRMNANSRSTSTR